MSRNIRSIAPRTGPIANGAPRSTYRHADELVLLAMPLRPGDDRDAGSRFGESVWNLAPALFRENQPPGHARLDFMQIKDPAQQLIAKEYLWARLNKPPPAGAHRTRLSPTVAANTLRYLKRFMRFVAARTGRFHLSDVDQPLLDAYLAHARSAPYRTANEVARILDSAIDLNCYAIHLTGGGFACRPWAGRSAHRVAGCTPHGAGQENRTARIPGPVIAELLSWALEYVEVFSHDIFAAREELTRLAKAGIPRLHSEESLRTRLVTYIGQRCVAGRGIPLISTRHGGRQRTDPVTGEPDPPINYPLIAQQIGCCTASVRNSVMGLRELLINATARLGGEIGGLDTPIAIRTHTQRPWRERFDARSVANEEKMLQAACYVVCAYLSGMRDSEVQSMRAGSHALTRSSDGVIERHRIESRAYKGYGGRGLRAQWITIAPVGRAIAVLERLTASRRARGSSDSLWLPLGSDRARRAALGEQALILINRFRDHLDSTFGDATTPAIPHVDGHPWHFTTRQFRRTIAWYIANRPFGTVAGKIQYQHASIAMFEGYAGGSPSGLRREIEQERALGQLEDIVEHYEDFRRGLKPTGPATARILVEFERIQQALEDFPGRLVDRQRLRAMLAHLSRNLHVGLLNDCFFERATALCLERSGAQDHSAPPLSHCSPDRCPNSCLTARHLPPWERAIAEAEGLLQDTRLSVLQRKTLVDEKARMQRLIAPLKEPKR